MCCENVSVSVGHILFLPCQTASGESVCHSKQLTEASVKDPVPDDSDIAKGLEQGLNTEPWARTALGRQYISKAWSSSCSALPSQRRGVLGGVAAR